MSGRKKGAAEAVRRELARRELARRHLGAYAAYVHGAGWKETGLSRFLHRRIEAFLEEKSGRAYDLLVLETPPQHGKSMAVTETAPAWFLGRHPESRVILASYNEESARRFGRRNGEKVRQFGPILFGRGMGRIDRDTEFELDNGVGRLISRGLLSGITGNPADLVVIDDPVKNRQDADSPVMRETVWEEWQNSIKSRLAAGAKVIVIMTPWHEDDLAGRILRCEPGAQLVRLPVEAEEGDPMGRKPGAALAPELGKDEKWLKQFKESYVKDARGGARAWQALYQCAPRTEEGNLVKREWWRWYDPGETRGFDSTLLSVDAAFKGEENNDYVAIQVWSRRGSDFFLRYALKQHLDFPGTLNAIRSVKRLYPECSGVLIEDKANGPAIIQTLGREMAGVIPVTPEGGKVARVNAVSPAIESGHVFLPEGAAWAEEFIDEWTAFPAGAHDDQVDAASQCLNRLIYWGGKGTVQTGDAGLRRILDGDIYQVY